MHLESERIILRDFVMDDLQDLHEIFSDPEIMEYVEPPYDMEKTSVFLKSFCIDRDPKAAYAAALKETGKVIGYILFKPFPDNPEIFEVGWIFNKCYWRQGYAYEICSRLFHHGFEDMRLHRICAEATDIKKSTSLMKKLGMQFEGALKKHEKTNDGEWCDLYWYGILEEDYFRG